MVLDALINLNSLELTENECVKYTKKYIRENVKRKVVKQDLFLEVKEELLYIVPFIKKMVCLML